MKSHCPLTAYSHMAILLFMKRLITSLKAVADSTRFKILKLLAFQPACVCELTAVLGLAQPTVSKHLRILENAGLVESERNGMRVDYRLHSNPDGEAKELLECVSRWLEGNAEIEKLRKRLVAVCGKVCDVKEDVC